MNAPATMQQLPAGHDLRDVPGWEGLYAVTRDGRVWAHPRVWSTGIDGNIPMSHGGKWLRLFTDRRGYIRVNLKCNGLASSVNVHRLVALAWIPNPLALPQVNHINGVKGHNSDENLEWCTASENKLHAHRTGLVNLDTDTFRASVRKNQKYASAAMRKLTFAQAEDARRRVAGGECKSHVAKSLGIAFATLGSLLRRETYVE